MNASHDQQQLGRDTDEQRQRQAGELEQIQRHHRHDQKQRQRDGAGDVDVLDAGSFNQPVTSSRLRSADAASIAPIYAGMVSPVRWIAALIHEPSHIAIRKIAMVFRTIRTRVPSSRGSGCSSVSTGQRGTRELRRQLATRAVR